MMAKTVSIFFGTAEGGQHGWLPIWSHGHHVARQRPPHVHAVSHWREHVLGLMSTRQSSSAMAGWKYGFLVLGTIGAGLAGAGTRNVCKVNWRYRRLLSQQALGGRTAGRQLACSWRTFGCCVQSQGLEGSTMTRRMLKMGGMAAIHILRG